MEDGFGLVPFQKDRTYAQPGASEDMVAIIYLTATREQKRAGIVVHPDGPRPFEDLLDILKRDPCERDSAYIAMLVSNQQVFNWMDATEGPGVDVVRKHLERKHALDVIGRLRHQVERLMTRM